MDGIYLVVNGTLKYTMVVPYQEPLEAQTKNKWFRDRAKVCGIQNKAIERDITYFTRAASVGIEEIFRDYIMAKQDNVELYYHKHNLQRDFTCACSSMNAKVLFLDFELILPIIRNQELPFLEKIFKERRFLIMKNLEKIDNVNNLISGSRHLIHETPMRKHSPAT